MVQIRTAPRTNGTTDGLPKLIRAISSPPTANTRQHTPWIIAGLAVATILALAILAAVQTTRLGYETNPPVAVSPISEVQPSLLGPGTTIHYYVQAAPAPIEVPSSAPSLEASAPTDTGSVSTSASLTEDGTLARHFLEQSLQAARQTANALYNTPGTDAERAFTNMELAFAKQDSDPLEALLLAAHSRLTAEAAQVTAANATAQ